MRHEKIDSDAQPGVLSEANLQLMAVDTNELFDRILVGYNVAILTLAIRPH